MKKSLKILLITILTASITLGITLSIFGQTSQQKYGGINPRIKSTQYKLADGWSDWSIWENTNDDVNYNKKRGVFIITNDKETIYCLLISELTPKEDNIGNKIRTFYCEYGENKSCEIRMIYRTDSKTKQIEIDLLDKKIKYVYI